MDIYDTTWIFMYRIAYIWPKTLNIFGFLICCSPQNQNADSNLSEYNYEGESEF